MFASFCLYYYCILLRLEYYCLFRIVCVDAMFAFSFWLWLLGFSDSRIIWGLGFFFFFFFLGVLEWVCTGTCLALESCLVRMFHADRRPVEAGSGAAVCLETSQFWLSFWGLERFGALVMANRANDH